MQTEIKNQWIYEQSPNEVWEYLTQAELIALWLMPNDFEPILGHQFQFRINPIPSLDLDGIIDCKILEIVPFQKLTYTWKGGPGKGVITLDTIVEWTLKPYGNGTKLLLKHSGFKEINLAIFNSMSEGWEKKFQNILNLLNKAKT
jgi:uncharacterized protein YndB with AHSA1/START domain